MQIKSSPFNYQAHVERIKLFRKCGEYEQLLAARKEMADLFPLTQVVNLIVHVCNFTWILASSEVTCIRHESITKL